MSIKYQISILFSILLAMIVFSITCLFLNKQEDALTQERVSQGIMLADILEGAAQRSLAE